LADLKLEKEIAGQVIGKHRWMDWIRTGLVPVLLATIISSVILYNRNLVAVPDQSYLHVFLWQFLAWLPWAAIFPLTGSALEKSNKTPVQWAVISFLAAFGCTIWFILVSDLASPYLGQPQTMFGLYKWFLIFWFVLSLLLFWANIGFSFLKARAIYPLSVTSSEDNDQLLAIWQSGGHIVVEKKDIICIEAKDFYARIHLENGKSYWVKMRLNDFMKELKSDRFVRGHRSAIVNLGHLKEIKRVRDQNWEAILTNNHRVRLSRSGKTSLEEAMKVIR